MVCEIVNAYIEGMTLRQIAIKYHVSHTYVYHYIPKNLRRKHKLTLYHADVIEDYKNGMPIRDIGEKYEITKANIYIILKGNDVELRKGR